MKKAILLMLLLIGELTIAEAQTETNKHNTKLPTFREVPSLTFKYIPLAALEPIYNTFELGLEYKFKPKLSIQGQFGYGTHKSSIYYDADLGDTPYRTYRMRGELRFYLGSSRSNKSTRRVLYSSEELEQSSAYQSHITEQDAKKHQYLALDIAHKNTIFFEAEMVGQDCENGVCAYERFTNYQRIKNVSIMHLKYGIQQFYTKNFCVDYYVGLGLRFVNVRLSDPSIEQGLRNDAFFFDAIDARSPGTFIVPSITLGVKLGYSIALKRVK